MASHQGLRLSHLLKPTIYDYMPKLEVPNYVPKLSDEPLDWTFNVYAWITDSTNLIIPRSEGRVKNGEYEEFDVWTLLVTPLDRDYQDKIQYRLEKALRRIESPYPEKHYKPRLGVFEKYDLKLESLFPISLIGEAVEDTDRLEGRVVECSFNLFSYEDGLITATPRVVDIKPKDYHPEPEAYVI